MNRIFGFIRERVNTIRTWVNENRAQIVVRFDRVSDVVGTGFEAIIRLMGRMIIIGFILNIINHFYPQFSENFPTIYGFFNGWTEFAEFAYKVVIKSVYALFTGNLPEFWAEYKEALNALWEAFKNWSAAITF